MTSNWKQFTAARKMLPSVSRDQVATCWCCRWNSAFFKIWFRFVLLYNKSLSYWPTAVLCFLFTRHDWNQLTVPSESPTDLSVWLWRASKRLWSTVSNTFERSKKTAQVTWPESMFRSTSSAKCVWVTLVDVVVVRLAYSKMTMTSNKQTNCYGVSGGGWWDQSGQESLSNR